MHFDFVLSKSESPEHVKFGSMFLPHQPVMVGKALIIKAYNKLILANQAGTNRFWLIMVLMISTEPF
jgi:hypothetical protein